MATTSAAGTSSPAVPVSGGPHDIAVGRLTLFAGGDRDAMTRIQPVLRSRRLQAAAELGAGLGQLDEAISALPDV